MNNVINYKYLYKNRKKQLDNSNKPIITFVTNNVPLELISACNDALSWESYKMLYGMSSKGTMSLPIPEDFCDICRQCALYESSNLGPKPSMIISSTICAQMMRTSEYFSDICNTYIMDIPKVQKRESDREYWYNEVLRLKSLLEEINGESIDKKLLITSVERRRQNGKYLKEIMDTRQESIIPLSALEARHIYLAQYMLGEEEYQETLFGTKQKVLERLSNKESKYSEMAPRLMLIGPLASEILYDDTDSDFIVRLYNCIESMDAAIVVEQSYLDLLYQNDIDVDGDVLKQIADRYINMPVTSYQATNDTTLAAIQELAKKFKVDGVLYISAKFCDTYAYQVGMYEKAFKAAGIPLLRLELGNDDFREGQLSIRLEPFIFMLKSKRIKKIKQ